MVKLTEQVGGSYLSFCLRYRGFCRALPGSSGCLELFHWRPQFCGGFLALALCNGV